jgi:hypothetical protein
MKTFKPFFRVYWTEWKQTLTIISVVLTSIASGAWLIGRAVDVARSPANQARLEAKMALIDSNLNVFISDNNYFHSRFLNQLNQQSEVLAAITNKQSILIKNQEKVIKVLNDHWTTNLPEWDRQSFYSMNSRTNYQ